MSAAVCQLRISVVGQIAHWHSGDKSLFWNLVATRKEQPTMQSSCDIGHLKPCSSELCGAKVGSARKK